MKPLAIALLLPALLFAQGSTMLNPNYGANKIAGGNTLPASCTNSQLYYLHVAPKGLYQCVDSAWTMVTYGATNLTTAGRVAYIASTGTLTQSAAWTIGDGHLLAVTDNTYDIGASGATRPRDIYIGGNLRAGGGVYSTNILAGLNATSLRLGVDGNALLTNNTANAFSLLQFGGTTSSFPSIKRNATAINFRLADDSADAPITAAGATFSGNVTPGPALSGGAAGGYAPVWTKYTKTYADAAFLAAASAVSIELGTLPASTVVHAIRLKHSTAFAGTGITSLTCSVGDGTTHDLFLAAVDVFAAVGNTALGIDGGASQPTIASQTLTLRCTANTNVGDGGATVLTAGSLTVHVLTSTLVE